MNDCPPESELVALSRGQMEFGTGEVLRAHFSVCAICKRRFSELLTAYKILPSSSLAEDSPNDSQSPPKPNGEAFVGRYKILREIATGGMGRVYLAEQPNTHRNVALKVALRNDAGFAALDRILRQEGRRQAALYHPRIPYLIEAGEDQDQTFLAMHYVAGKDLSKDLPLGDVNRAARYVADLAKTVSYLHFVGFIHRDLKPANILIQDGSDNVFLADFGLTLRLSAHTNDSISLVDSSNKSTESQEFLGGTKGYMSPEQTQRRPLDVRSDIYSLGAVLFELLTGRVPDLNGEEEKPAHKENNRSTLASYQPRISEDLQVICLKCLEWQRENRFASADVLHQRLTQYLAGEPIPERPLPWTREVVRLCSKNRLAAGSGAAALILLFVVAAISTWAYFTTSHALQRETDALEKVSSALAGEKHSRGQAETAVEIMATAMDELKKVQKQRDETLVYTKQLAGAMLKSSLEQFDTENPLSESGSEAGKNWAIRTKGMLQPILENRTDDLDSLLGEWGGRAYFTFYLARALRELNEDKEACRLFEDLLQLIPERDSSQLPGRSDSPSSLAFYGRLHFAVSLAKAGQIDKGWEMLNAARRQLGKETPQSRRAEYRQLAQAAHLVGRGLSENKRCREATKWLSIATGIFDTLVADGDPLSVESAIAAHSEASFCELASLHLVLHADHTVSASDILEDPRWSRIVDRVQREQPEGLLAIRTLVKQPFCTFIAEVRHGTRDHDFDKAEAFLATAAQGPEKDSGTFQYLIARSYCVCANALAASEDKDEKARHERLLEKASQAMQLAVAQGYKRLDEFESDPVTKELRTRKEIQSLLSLQRTRDR